MSLNNILTSLTPGGLDTDFNRHQNVKVSGLNIDSGIYLENNGFNRPNFTLQCYAPGRARFLPQAFLNQLEYDVIKCECEFENNPDLFTFTEDVLTNFTILDGVTLRCNNAGLYWVMIKISKENMSFGLTTSLALGIDADLVPESYTSSPCVINDLSNTCNVASFLLRLNVNEILSLTGIYYPEEAPAFATSNSAITFIKINAA